MILLDALYINNGGGKVLLDYLVEELNSSKLTVFYLLDKRVRESYPFLPEEHTYYIKGSLISRHRFYRKNANKWCKVLCFGNIPPTIRLSCPVYTYFHNVLYLDLPDSFSWRLRLVQSTKSWIVRRLILNTDEWWVQTEVIRELMTQAWGVSNNKIKVKPFFPPFPRMEIENREPHSFLYVSDGHPYKQHRLLLDAFERIQTIYPSASLSLTISNQYADLLAEIMEFEKRGINVKNLGWVNKKKLSVLYNKCEYFVYPSTRESFSLGLVEAAQCGMKIVAPNLPYVDAVVQPSLTFEPNNIMSLYDTMMGALSNSTEIPLAKLKIQNEIYSILQSLE